MATRVAEARAVEEVLPQVAVVDSQEVVVVIQDLIEI